MMHWIFYMSGFLSFSSKVFSRSLQWHLSQFLRSPDKKSNFRVSECCLIVTLYATLIFLKVFVQINLRNSGNFEVAFKNFWDQKRLKVLSC